MAKVGIFTEAPRKKFKYDTDTEVELEYIDKARVNTVLMKGAEAAKKLKTAVGPMQDIFLGKVAVHGWNKIGSETEPGFVMPDGTPLPFSPENRNTMMTKVTPFSEFVYRTCTDPAKFLEEEVELAPEDLIGLDKLLDAVTEDDLGNV